MRQCLLSNICSDCPSASPILLRRSILDMIESCSRLDLQLTAPRSSGVRHADQSRVLRGRQLRLGATIGSIAVMCVVFLFGFGGVLASWSGLFVPAGPDDEGNTILFSLLDNVDGHRHTIIVVVVAVLCAAAALFHAPCRTFQRTTSARS